MNIELLKIAVKAAYIASEEILKIYNHNFKVEYKSDKSPLTEADVVSNKIILNELSSTPYPVISEESISVDHHNRKGCNRYWLIDPLDGTKEFIKKTGEFTINIALIENGHPILGVVMVPVSSIFYLGFEQGSFKAIQNEHFNDIHDLLDILGNDLSILKKINISGSINSSLNVVISKSHSNEATTEFIKNLADYYGEINTIPKGSSIKLCLVAEGVADLYIRIGPTSEWDTAAAHAVVHYAGGKVFIYDEAIKVSEYIVDNLSLSEIIYSKENILNPYFIVSGVK